MKEQIVANMDKTERGREEGVKNAVGRRSRGKENRDERNKNKKIIKKRR